MKEKILEYFNQTGKYYLIPLDNKYRKLYTGVTLNYITYDLLKAKYRKSDVAKIVKELQQKEEIKSLFCHDVNQYVFEPKLSQHSSLSPLTGTHMYFENRNVHEYLNNFIKNE